MVKPATAAAVLLAVPALAIAACSPNQNPSTNTPGTTPSVWVGSSSPGASPTESQPAAGGRKLTAKLNANNGRPVATATFEFTGDFATITIETVGNSGLEPGFHGLHLHQIGECMANSTAPNGTTTGDFLSAGGHFQVPGHDGQHPASGDLSSLQVRGDGSAMLVTTTDAFTADELLAGRGTAIIIHEDADNFANIPDRYTAGGKPGPDADTFATGDAGKRVACGVITG